MWTITGEGQKIYLGKVTDDGKLIPADKAQAGWWFPWRRPRNRVYNFNLNFNVGSTVSYLPEKPRRATTYYY